MCEKRSKWDGMGWDGMGADTGAERDSARKKGVTTISHASKFDGRFVHARAPGRERERERRKVYQLSPT